ncbi:cytokine receptor common subunit beta isoform X2 [Hemicordylus capensis]|uniref:cytokine receptor common subunit beta isoform X2 n=1 Tax=Hemicordylus capensis TaxID=884348 RepID=UPI002303D160|nr:cytokine receptor common subunit beta isoform X2 [Hemicordylus capensis]
MKFCSILLILRLTFYSAVARKSPLMQTLHCFNDYTSYTACTWLESRDAWNLIKMTLFHKDNYDLNLAQMTCHSLSNDSWINWSCYRNQSEFAPSTENTYIFKPDRELEVQLNVSLLRNVQPPPPKELNVSVKKGYFLLTWKPGGRTQRINSLEDALDFEVAYKRSWEPWQKSSSVLVSKTSCSLPHNNLVPGSIYVARIRSKPNQDSGLSGYYSEWSSEVSWKTQKADEAQPKNVRCLFNGIDTLKCSWEVKQEITSSVLFSLFYKASPESNETECSPVHEKELTPISRHVLQSCEINVTDPNSQYIVSVRSKEEMVMRTPMYHIKPKPPYKLSIKIESNQEYILKWEDRPAQFNIPKKYHIAYWKTVGAFGEEPEIKYQSVDNDFKEYSFTFLEPSTSYSAKVRAIVNGYAYKGSWSEWSQEFHWKTESVLPSWIIPLIAAILITLMMAVIFWGHAYCVKKKWEWEASIPSPPQKFLLHDYFQKKQLPSGSHHVLCQNYSEEEVLRCLSRWERQRLVSSSESLGAWTEKTKSPSVASPKKGTLETFPLPVANADQSLRQGDASPTLVGSHDAKVRLAHQIYNLNGPYLYSLPESFLPDVQQDLEIAPSETRGTPVVLQYVELPHNMHFPLLPVGKEKTTAPPLCIVHDHEEEKKPFSNRQEVSQAQAASGKLEEGERPKNHTSTNNTCQIWPLDYIASADLPLTKERGSPFLLPVMASEEEMPTCSDMATSASQLSQTNEEFFSTESCQKKPDSVPPTEDRAPAAPLRSLPQGFDNYVMTFPGTPVSVPKEELPFSTDQTRNDNGLLMFNPDGKSPVFLHQVDEYCFFPGPKPNQEAPKGEKESVGHQLSESNQAVIKVQRESKFVGDKLQTTPRICQGPREPVPQ